MALQTADTKTPLVLNSLDRDTFEQLRLKDMVDPNQLYFVTEDRIDANDKPIINVGDPQNDTDAANKQYVIDMIGALKALIAGSSSFDDLKAACS